MEINSIARRIRAFRKLKGLTQMELSEKMNVSIAVIGAIERGTRRPEDRILIQIAEVLGISIDELIGNE